MDEQKTAVVILARGGSKGVPGKNLRKVAGLSLVARAVRAGRTATGVSGVWVSTEDEAIAAEARRHGAHVVDRPAELSSDGASSESGWLHAVGPIRAALPGLERLVFLQCTSPFTTGADIDACLAAMEDQRAECALSVLADHSFLWGFDGNGFGRGINHDESLPRPRRQDLPPSFRESGAVYVVRLAPFERTGRRFCGRAALCELDHPPLEIDSFDDLALATALARLRPGAMVPEAPMLSAIRAVVTDFDGVHTDDRVSTDQHGTEAVACSRRDGLGLGHLRDSGRVHLLILSKEKNPVVLERARKLRIEALGGIDDKAAALEAWLRERGITWEAVLYVGNDINDAAVMSRAGLGACPADAHPDILAQADWVLPAPGGRGALRALCDRLLMLEDRPE